MGKSTCSGPSSPVYPGGGPRKTDVREVLDAILDMLPAGCQRRSPPEGFPPRNTVWRYFDEWPSNGTLDSIQNAFLRNVRTRDEPYRPRTMARVDSHSVATASVGEELGRDDAKNTDAQASIESRR